MQIQLRKQRAEIPQTDLHFAFPESMLKMMLPVGSGLLISYMFRAGKEHKKECRDTRIDIDRRLKQALTDW